MEFICLAILVFAFFGPALWKVSKRYERRLANIAIVLIVILSIGSAFITFTIGMQYLDDNLEIDPNISWHQVTSVEKPATELIYQEELGLFAETGDIKVKIADVIPICLPDGDIAHNNPLEAELTTEPYIKLSKPLQDITQQLSFNISYSVTQMVEVL